MLHRHFTLRLIVKVASLIFGPTLLVLFLRREFSGSLVLNSSLRNIEQIKASPVAFQGSAVIPPKRTNSSRKSQTVKTKVLKSKEIIFPSKEYSSHLLNESDILIKSNWKLDDTQQYYRSFDVFVGSGLKQLHSNTINQQPVIYLASQTSVDSLYLIPRFIGRWNGPVSISIFVPKNMYKITIRYLKYLLKCFPDIFDLLRLHFLYPKIMKPVRETIEDEFVEHLVCSDLSEPDAALEKIKRLSQYHVISPELMPYPQSHMRNLARLALRRLPNSEQIYSLVLDIDFVLCDRAHEMTQQYFSNTQQVQEDCGNESKCAYVIPGYEVAEKAVPPRTRKELLQSINDNSVRQYHKYLWWRNGGFTNFEKYEQETDNNLPHISHKVEKAEFYYEPFYVALEKHLPLYQEIFLGYGMTRNTQVYEMMLSDYRFLVLSPLFGLHYGFSNRSYIPEWRRSQINANVNQFWTELNPTLCRKYNAMDWTTCGQQGRRVSEKGF